MRCGFSIEDSGKAADVLSSSEQGRFSSEAGSVVRSGRWLEGLMVSRARGGMVELCLRR